jgi:hypothetical protein
MGYGWIGGRRLPLAPGWLAGGLAGRVLTTHASMSQPAGSRAPAAASRPQ